MDKTANVKELLRTVDLKVLTVQRTAAGRWWNFRRVISPFSRLWLILDGRAVVKHHGRTFELRPGTLHLVPAFTPHDCTCASRFDHFHLHFLSRAPTGIDLFSLLDCEWQVKASTALPKLFQSLETIFPDRKLPCFNPAREEYRRLPSSLEQIEHETPVSAWWESQSILRLLLTPLLATARIHEGMHVRVTQRFLAVEEFIHQHMAEPLELADLAKVAGLHPTYFSDRFEQTVGVRPLNYLTHRRMERAQYLLLTSPASIKEISFATGFPDPAYFSRVFTQHCRVSPTAYRLAHTR